MLLLEISKQIELKKGMGNDDANKTFDWRPTEAKEYVLPQFIVPKSRKSADTKRALSKVLAFVDMNKQRRLAHGCTIMPISVKDRRFLSIVGYPMAATRLIAFMCKIGLLEIEDSYYQYNAFRYGYNRSKTYRYYYENEVKLKEYCKANDISKFTWKNYTATKKPTKPIPSFEASAVRFSSKLHLLRPDNYSCKEFEDYLLLCLYENYPRLAEYQNLVDEINEKYYSDLPDFTIKMIPSFTWTKGNTAVRKIGIRATNHYVSASNKSKDDDNEDYHGLFKEDILRDNKLYLHKDVRSSVPRITLSLNNGYWINENIDIYEEIYNQYLHIHNNNIISKYSVNDIINDNIVCDTVVNTFAEAREAIKSLHMRAYFDTEKRLGVHTRRAMLNVYNKDAVDTEMAALKRAVVSAEGGVLYDSEIFLHESCIYMDVLKILLEEGYFVWECYDAFYATEKDGVTQEEYERHVTDLVEACANSYITNYLIEKISA